MDGWMDGLVGPDGQILIFKSFSTVWQSFLDNGRVIMKAVVPCLQLKRFLPPVGIKPRTARSADQCLIHKTTGS